MPLLRAILLAGAGDGAAEDDAVVRTPADAEGAAVGAEGDAHGGGEDDGGIVVLDVGAVERERVGDEVGGLGHEGGAGDDLEAILADDPAAVEEAVGCGDIDVAAAGLVDRADAVADGEVERGDAEVDVDGVGVVTRAGEGDGGRGVDRPVGVGEGEAAEDEVGDVVGDGALAAECGGEGRGAAAIRDVAADPVGGVRPERCRALPYAVCYLSGTCQGCRNRTHENCCPFHDYSLIHTIRQEFIMPLARTGSGK